MCVYEYVCAVTVEHCVTGDRSFDRKHGTEGDSAKVCTVDKRKLEKQKGSPAAITGARPTELAGRILRSAE